jgi:tetratricopeptide (TPR) repeat protein
LRAGRLIAASSLAILAACGGTAEPTPRVATGVPLVGMLANPDGPGALDLRRGRAQDARSQIEAALARDPDGAALSDLALCYAAEERFDAARQLLDEALSRRPAREQQAALVNLAELYAVDGYLSAAEAHLASARAVDPARPEPLYAIALLASARGDRAAARDATREALRADEGGAVRRGLAYIYPEERLHLAALVAWVSGDAARSEARWRELARSRFPTLAQVAQRHLEEP